MGLWEIRLEVRHDAPLAKVSTVYPAVPLHLWALGRQGWIQISAPDPDEVERVAEALVREGIRVVDRSGSETARLLRVQYSSLEDRGLVGMFAAHQCQVIAPWIYLAGWAQFRVLSFGEESAHQLFRSLRAFPEWRLSRKVELSASTPPTPIWVESLLDGLTDRQVRAFREAHRAGYYHSPRGTTLAWLAARQGIGRSTFEEHLRLAQNRILVNLAELVGGPSPTATGRPPTAEERPRRSPFGGPARRGGMPRGTSAQGPADPRGLPWSVPAPPEAAGKPGRSASTTA